MGGLIGIVLGLHLRTRAADRQVDGPNDLSAAQVELDESVEIGELQEHRVAIGRHHERSNAGGERVGAHHLQGLGVRHRELLVAVQPLGEELVA